MRQIRLLALLMCLILMSGCVQCLAEEEETYIPTEAELILSGRPVSDEPTKVTIGNATKVSGSFFSNQFGNNTSDIDVRNNIHGYNPIAWVTQLEFIADTTVVKELTTSQDESGNTIYTLRINGGLVWNDGETPVTARDYVFSYLLQASPQFAAIGAQTGSFDHIVGYEDYQAGRTTAFAGIRLINDYTYSVTVKKEYEPYYYELSYLSIYPSPIGVLAPGCKVQDSKNGAHIVNDSDAEAEPLFTAKLLQQTVLDPDTGYLTHPMLTCGPYNLTEVDLESGRVEFDLNHWYKGNYEGVVSVIDHVTLVEAPTSRQQEMLINGEVDVINKVVSGTAINSILVSSQDLPISMLSYARLGYSFLAFACEKGPQQFAKVRQAIAYCFDTDSFTRDYLKGYGLTVDGYMGLGQWMYMAAIGNLRPTEMSESEAEAWDAVSLEGLEHYSKDLDKAKQLLIEDGWNLNAEGNTFTEGTDQLRYKDVDGTLMPLSFTFAQTRGSEAAEMAVHQLQEAFEVIGAELKVEIVSFTELLKDYYRENGERCYDINFMATNFVSTFDPYMNFASGEDHSGAINTSGLQDDELIELAWAMHTTAPGDDLTFLENWRAFQQRFNELLPTMPIYSNVYMDFYSDNLHNYYASAEIGWPAAILYSWWQEDTTASVEGDEDEEGSFEDDEMIIID